MRSRSSSSSSASSSQPTDILQIFVKVGGGKCKDLIAVKHSVRSMKHIETSALPRLPQLPSTKHVNNPNLNT